MENRENFNNENYNNEDINNETFNTEEESVQQQEDITVEVVTEDEVPPAKNWKKELLDWVVSIAVAVVIALVVRNFVFAFVEVEGESMYPTLNDGDRLFTRIIAYSEPMQGDIIIFNPPISETDRQPNKETAYVKRVIAVEGQVVDITADGTVVVDGKKLSEDYISEAIKPHTLNGTQYPFTVPEDTVFVLGDNRNRSHDSRSLDVGAVPIDNIIGKAQLRILPLNVFGSLYK